MIAEIRQAGDDTISVAVLEADTVASITPRRYFGIVGYLHGPGIDHPIGITRNYLGSALPVVAHYHGLYGVDGATQLNGTLLSPCTGGVVCYDDNLGNQPDFAGRRMTYGFVIPSPSLGPVSWWGSMANAKQNATGTLDMRNRVYDSRTGRFTQEDPIGLAGGIHLYGFAGGDPVNFSDPLGLCPLCETALGSILMNAIDQGDVTFNARNEAKIETLDASLQHPARQFMNQAFLAGEDLRITSGFRSSADQDALYAQGRTTSGDIVTNAKGGQSYHNFGLAFDVSGVKKGELTWDVDSKAVNIGKGLGFEWGGDWKTFKDRPHFQMTGGKTLEELRKANTPP